MKNSTNVVINSEVLKAVAGKPSRRNVQKAIQRVLSSDRPNLRLLKQLCALDLSLEVETTVLLDLDDKARNLNNPARLAATYKDMRALMASDEEDSNADGWEELLAEACEVQDLETPTLELIDGGTPKNANSAEPPTGDAVGDGQVTEVGKGGGVGSSPSPPPPSTTPYPPALRASVVRALMRGSRSKAAIARDFSVSLATVNRWYKLHITEAKPLPS